jgi:hypothetical protein
MDPGVESQIREWRSYLLRRQTIQPSDVEELEDHLRSEMTELGASGLSPDESFLVALKRLGGINELSREFAREQSARIWRQLVLAGGTVRERSREWYLELAATVCFAIAAALLFKAPALFGIDPFAGSGATGVTSDEAFYLRNGALLALPALLAFFGWRRKLSWPAMALLAAPFLAAAVLGNAYPFKNDGDTIALVAIHLALLLWLVLGVAYLGGEWRSAAPRMDFVRFTGEWVIYFALVALGGGVLTAITLNLFKAIDIDLESFVGSWVLPCGAVGAVVVVAWLVEAKQSVIENMAPVLTAVFSPLFAVMLLAALVGMVVSGNTIHADRDVLILFDVLLVLVLGLVLYSFSARDSAAERNLLDGVQLVLVTSALLIDGLALAAMVGRINDFGWSPNRTAGLGLNVVLLANLAWTAWLLLGFLRARRPFADLERWQTRYAPVYAAWALIVVVAFPPLFGFD